MTLELRTSWLPVFVIIAAVAGCSYDAGSYSASNESPVKATPEPEVKPHSPVRSFDFANFTYPAKPVYANGLRTFALKEGTYEGKDDYEPVYLSYLVYGDVTGDGQEEALVTLVIGVRGTAIPFSNYIYSAVDGKPKLLWAFKNGDRADEGLRQIYAENGELVLERFSPIGKNGAFATQFSRARYRWNGTRFQQTGTVELLPNPTENSSPVMKPYRRADESKNSTSFH